ncbi:XRE family transcriptional regulator [Rapidithrix thailandica]|uniref:XRE family transcriptional regulator n=1 Tax=Rapidithrix thailandica TaxID=413964 RepID=A0AAW9SFX7_9BACT
MKEEIILQISQRIKEIRKRKKLRIQEVAEKANVSKGLISQIENGRTIPSLLVLIQIIRSMGEDLNSFFEGFDTNSLNKRIFVKKASEYTPFEKEDAQGFLYKRIFTKNFDNSTVDIILLELEEDAQREFVQTQAYEYKYILRGRIEYEFESQSVILEEGDSMLFDGRLKHSPKNIGKGKAQMLVIYFFEEGHPVG